MHRLDTPLSWLPFVLKQASWWRHVPSIPNVVPHQLHPGLRPNRETRMHGVFFRPKPPKPSISAWPPHDLLDVDACPISRQSLTPSLSPHGPPTQLAIVFPLDLVDVVFILHLYVLLLFDTPRGSLMTPPRLFGSIVPQTFHFTLCRRPPCQTQHLHFTI